MAGIGIWQIVDPKALSTVLFDCNDITGVGGTLPTGVGSAVRELQLRPPALDAERISAPGAPGGITAYAQDGLVVTTWKQVFLNVDGATTYDELKTAARNLGKLLRKGGVIKFTPEGSATAMYLDFEPSSYLALFVEERDAYHALTARQFGEGIDVDIVRQPYAREADSTIVSAAAVDNGALAADFGYTNPGTAPSPAKVSVKVASSTAETAQVILGLRSKRDNSADDLTEFRAEYQFIPTTPAALTAKWKKIWNKQITPSPLSGLEGTFRVYAALKLGADDYEIQLRGSMTSDDPPGQANPVLQFSNANGAAMAEFAETDLGTVTFDREGSVLQLELWARSDAAANITWGDQVTLVPADEQLIIMSTPGQRQGRFFRADFDARTLDLSGGTLSSDDDYVLLNALNEHAENDGVVLPAGRYFAQFIGRVRNATGVREKIGELQVFEAGIEIRDANIYSRKGQVWTSFDRSNPKRVTFQADGTSAYKIRVVQTIATSADKEIRVRKLIRWMVPRVRSSDQFVVDAFGRKAYIANTSGGRKWPLVVEGGLPLLAPGDGVGIIRLGDASTATPHLESDPRGSLAEAVPARAATVTVVVTPMHPL